MSQSEVERFLGRLITDAGFRARATRSLETACCCEGITVSAEEMALLSLIDFARFDLVAGALDDSLRRK